MIMTNQGQHLNHIRSSLQDPKKAFRRKGVELFIKYNFPFAETEGSTDTAGGSTSPFGRTGYDQLRFWLISSHPLPHDR